MISKHQISLLLFGAIYLISCENKDPNTNAGGEDILTVHEIEAPIEASRINYADTIYVPIYSDIYVNASNRTSLLAATLSIRNTSLLDSLFISTIDYYNTKGDLVRSYLEKPIVLMPLESVDYVIEKEDDAGGSGANFILTLSANSAHVKPVIQAVMIGNDGNKGFSFSTEGYSICQGKN
jgi:hypothetical protein